MSSASSTPSFVTAFCMLLANMMAASYASSASRVGNREYAFCTFAVISELVLVIWEVVLLMLVECVLVVSGLFTVSLSFILAGSVAVGVVVGVEVIVFIGLPSSG